MVHNLISHPLPVSTPFPSFSFLRSGAFSVCPVSLWLGWASFGWLADRSWSTPPRFRGTTAALTTPVAATLLAHKRHEHNSPARPVSFVSHASRELTRSRDVIPLVIRAAAAARHPSHAGRLSAVQTTDRRRSAQGGIQTAAASVRAGEGGRGCVRDIGFEWVLRSGVLPLLISHRALYSSAAAEPHRRGASTHHCRAAAVTLAPLPIHSLR